MKTEKSTDCIFCKVNPDAVIYENEMAMAFFDAYPVSKGHILVVSKRHVENYFDLSVQEQQALWQAVNACKKMLDKMFSPDGFNIGINCGEAAGQTVCHVHVHVIPRYIGDMKDPKGGVRGVIPEKMHY